MQAHNECAIINALLYAIAGLQAQQSPQTPSVRAEQCAAIATVVQQLQAAQLATLLIPAVKLVAASTVAPIAAPAVAPVVTPAVVTFASVAHVNTPVQPTHTTKKQLPHKHTQNTRNIDTHKFRSKPYLQLREYYDHNVDSSVLQDIYIYHMIKNTHDVAFLLKKGDVQYLVAEDKKLYNVVDGVVVAGVFEDRMQMWQWE